MKIKINISFHFTGSISTYLYNRLLDVMQDNFVYFYKKDVF